MTSDATIILRDRTAAFTGPYDAGRDEAIDTMRGIAIVMVVGIHSLSQPLNSGWLVLVDAALRPAVPVFLFLSGYLTTARGKVPLSRRTLTVLVPYAIAFAAAYAYMAAHNPGMDHRPFALAVRFTLGYVFVYYYVFIYLACTLGLWLIFRAIDVSSPAARGRLTLVFVLGIGAGLVAGAYLDPLLARLGASEALIEEARLRDVPFWFSFAALGALVRIWNAMGFLREARLALWGAAGLAFLVYATVRLLELGDAARYDSTAFFAYAALFCCALLATRPSDPGLAAIGPASYFIYLWHIFPIMALRDHTSLALAGAALQSLATFAVALGTGLAMLRLIRAVMARRVSRWVGA